MTNPIEDKWRDQAINEKVESLQKGNQTVSFSDDDVKRLKAKFHYEDVQTVTWYDIGRLLARLEAAERGVFSLETVIRWMCQEGRYDKLTAGDLVLLQGAQITLEVWRKAAGKDGV